MLPINNIDTEVEVGSYTSIDFKFNFETDNSIFGTVDGRESVKQAIFNILNTERYQYIIYSWNYGIETKDLYGEPIDYVVAEISRRIEEALLQDDRIISITDFNISILNKHDISCEFTANTIYGDLNIEEVIINV